MGGVLRMNYSITKKRLLWLTCIIILIFIFIFYSQHLTIKESASTLYIDHFNLIHGSDKDALYFLEQFKNATTKEEKKSYIIDFISRVHRSEELSEGFYPVFEELESMGGDTFGLPYLAMAEAGRNYVLNDKDFNVELCIDLLRTKINFNETLRKDFGITGSNRYITKIIKNNEFVHISRFDQRLFKKLYDKYTEIGMEKFYTLRTKDLYTE